MNAPSSSSARLRTGLFEIDCSSGELFKSGRKLPVQGQPFRVLAMLLERPGEVVTREQLQARLWPADTYVSFDEGLNTAIRKLRIALGDSADNPRFIETLPKRGYRFIAPVSPVGEIRGAGGMRSEFADTSQNAEALAPETGALLNDTTNAVFVKKAALWKLIFICAAAVIIIAGGILLRSHFSPKPAPQKRVMLAILPFQNLSNDSAQEYFSDGLTEETITDLGQLSPEQLGVIARTSAMSYKHTQKTVGQIGQELGVDYILEGSVRREGGKARVSAQLIRVSDQTHLWAENYDRELQSVLDIESELGKTIAQQVQLNLTPQRERELAKLRTVDPEAYDLYLRGRYYWNQRTPPGIKESLGYFQQAIGKDPDFALAYAGLADAYNLSNIIGPLSPKESLPQAKAAAERAIQLDPSLAEAHAALGMEKSHYDFDFPGAEREFLKAIELNPNSAYAHLFYSNCYLMPMGRVQEAIAENKKALNLDPLSLPINNFMAMSYYFAGDYQKAYQQFQHTIEMDPTFSLAHDYLSGLLLVTDRYEEGIQEAEKSDLLRGTSPQEASARAANALKAFKSGGAKAFWEWNVNLLRRSKRPDGSVWAGGMAMGYAMAGDKGKAFEWLNNAYEQREGQDITLVKVDPLLKNLHGDARFTAFLKRMGLPAGEVQPIGANN